MCGVRGHVLQKPKQDVYPQRVPVSPAAPPPPPPCQVSLCPGQLKEDCLTQRGHTGSSLQPSGSWHPSASSRKPSLPTSCLPEALHGGSGTLGPPRRKPLCTAACCPSPHMAGGASVWMDLDSGPGGGKREGKPSPQPRLARNKVLLFSPFRLQHLFLDQLGAEGEGLTEPSPNIF